MTEYTPVPISPPVVQAERDPTGTFKDEYYIEQLIRAQEVGVLRDKLSWCYKREGVNHYESCRPLAIQYMKMLQQMRDGAFKAYN